MEGICCDCGETNKTACPAHWKSGSCFRLQPIKEATVTHRQLKPISAERIIKFNPPKIEFIKFLNEWGIRDDVNGIRGGFNDFIISIKEDHPCWLPWLEKHGFIEKVEEEVFYKSGDRFYYNGYNDSAEDLYHKDVYILNHGELNGLLYAQITSIRNGQPWNDLVEIKDRLKITKEVFYHICCGLPLSFSPIKEPS